MEQTPFELEIKQRMATLNGLCCALAQRLKFCEGALESLKATLEISQKSQERKMEEFEWRMTKKS